MAKIHSLFSKISGSVGDIVFVTRPGFNIARSRSLPMVDPTSTQLDSRSKFSFLSHMASLFYDPCLVNFWKSGLTPTDLRNDFISENRDRINSAIDYPHLICTFGSLSILVNYRTDYYRSTGRIRSRWNVVYNLNLKPTDFVATVCIYPGGNKLWISDPPALYSTGLLNFYVPANLTYRTIYTYGFVIRPESAGYLASISIYDEPAWV